MHDDSTQQSEWLDSMFFHEYLVYQIASYLGLAVPKSRPMRLGQEDRDKLPADIKERYPEGLYFISEMIDGAESNLLAEGSASALKQPWFQYFGNIANAGEIAAIVVMDLYIANFDRFRNTGNLLVAGGSDSRRIYAIDHGFAFWGHVWTKSRVGMMQLAGGDPAYTDIFVKKLMKTTPDQQMMGL
ncbi:hypothetical protein D3C84_902020 [compost metagenome]